MNITSPNKRVLIYGDSITWGRIPGETVRFDEKTRWTNLVQKQLGDSVEVIEEGLRARTLAGDNPYFSNRDGLQQFGPIFGSHLPLDLVVIFLGTNDVNSKTNKSPAQTADSLNDYIYTIAKWSEELGYSKLPDMLIISPPLIDERHINDDPMFAGGEEKSRQLAHLYKTIADKNDVHFFDAAQFVKACKEDGVHLDVETNSILAIKLAPVIKTILFT